MSLERIRTNCPRDCYDGCGIIVEKRNGDIKRVLGDPDHPVSRGALCSKCAVAYNGVWQDEGARLLYPLKRAGAKGSGCFHRVTWDEAADLIATRLGEIASRFGSDAIIHTHYSGTLSVLANAFPMRFFNRLGATEVEPDSICNIAGHVAWGLLFGESNVGFDPKTARDTSCILVWGANPAHSAPHAHKYWLAESPGTLIVVDPVRTPTAAMADLHLQPFPGSDAALAFSLLHVLQRDDFFDEGFITEHTLGAEELMPVIQRCTPDWGQAQTGVSATDIERAARMFGPGPSLLWAGQAVQRQRTGGNTMRAVGLLPTLTGNVGKPGAGFYYLNGTPAIAGLDYEALEGVQLRRGEQASISHMDLAARLAQPEPYRALLCWNTNPAASAPQQKRLHQALRREDLFSVVVDCFQTDTADFADIVLPAAGFLEFDDLTYSYFHLNIGAQAKAREPMGEALPNQQIFRLLARAMRFEEPELYEDDTTLIEQLLEQMKLGMDFAELKRKGWHPLDEAPVIFYADGKFNTPSGKIEIASERAVAMGLPRLPQPWCDARPGAGRLRLLTPASVWRMNDSYANDSHLIDQAGEATVTLNPADASALGIRDGMRVSLENETGQIELLARVQEIVPQGVALSYKGRWPKQERSGVNVNCLNAGHKSDMGEGTCVHGTEVTIRAC